MGASRRLRISRRKGLAAGCAISRTFWADARGSRGDAEPCAIGMPLAQDALVANILLMATDPVCASQILGLAARRFNSAEHYVS